MPYGIGESNRYIVVSIFFFFSFFPLMNFTFVKIHLFFKQVINNNNKHYQVSTFFKFLVLFQKQLFQKKIIALLQQISEIVHCVLNLSIFPSFYLIFSRQVCIFRNKLQKLMHQTREPITYKNINFVYLYSPQLMLNG